MREKREKIIRKQLQVYNTEMKMTSVSKVEFASLNVERYYFSDGIVPPALRAATLVRGSQH